MLEGTHNDHLKAYLASKTGLFTQVRKRDGRVVSFDPKAITRSIHAAGRETGEYSEDMAHRLTIKVIEYAYSMLTVEIPGVEDIQDIVEEVPRRRFLQNDGRLRCARQQAVWYL